MLNSVRRIKEVIRREHGTGVSRGEDGKRLNFSRNSSQTIGAQGDEPPLSDSVIRAQTQYRYPDDTRGLAFVNTVNGDRLQDFANTHLSEGEAPGRIPRFWNDRRSGKVGRTLTGNPVGDNFLTLDITGQSTGGIGDGKFVLHQQIPRGSVIARAFARTVDDAANVPAVYVSDPTRR